MQYYLCIWIFQWSCFSDIRNNFIILKSTDPKFKWSWGGLSKAKIFSLTQLKDYEGTSIYAGKKWSYPCWENLGNLASQCRQIYSQVPGLNIYQNDDAGLQLNIGGRGLDPNRSSNFNTRQNGYDISADVLGYPESYYTPPAEALNNSNYKRQHHFSMEHNLGVL